MPTMETGVVASTWEVWPKLKADLLKTTDEVSRTIMTHR